MKSKPRSHHAAFVRSAFTRSAFTLVELLVVITIMGMLMAMVFPAFSSVFELARQATCKTNIRTINGALDNFAANKQGYPGLVEVGRPSKEYPNGRRFTWAVALLPFMGQEPIYEGWNTPKGTMNVQKVNTFICGSDAEDTESDQQLSYVINSGSIEDGKDPRIAGGGQTLPRDINLRVFSNGIAFNRYVTSGVAPRVTKASVSNKKGLGQTLILTENIQAWNYADKRPLGGAPTPYDGMPSGNKTPGATEVQMYTGFAWNGFPINVGKDAEEDIQLIPKNPGNPRYARPSSAHPQLVMAAFGDGRIDALRSNIDYHVYQMLCMTDPKQAIGSGIDARVKTHALNEADFSN